VLAASPNTGIRCTGVVIVTIGIYLAATIDRGVNAADGRIAVAHSARVEIAALDGQVLAPVRGGIARVGRAGVAVIAISVAPAAIR
jgi:hypothetical protein